jgi:putative ABC transport system substrate-binding protein
VSVFKLRHYGGDNCPNLALTARLRRCSDSVCYVIYFCRVGEVTTMPLRFVFHRRQDRLAALALRHAVPAIYETHGFAAAGGLMSYGGSLTEAYRLTGVYAARGDGYTRFGAAVPAGFGLGHRGLLFPFQLVRFRQARTRIRGGMPFQQPTKYELMVNLKVAKVLGPTVPPTLLTLADTVIE